MFDEQESNAYFCKKNSSLLRKFRHFKYQIAFTVIQFMMVSILLESCGDSNKIDYKTRAIIDSLTLKETNRLTLILDSTCRADFSTNLKYYTDSLYKLRLNQIIRQQQQTNEVQ